jgi:hypothetical protein
MHKVNINDLSLHLEITPFQACSHTGHSTTNKNLDSYLDMKKLTPRIPAENALSGKNGLHAGIALRFIEELSIVDVPGFKEGGPKRRILRICAASFIMHHHQATRDMGPSNVVT